MSESPSSVQLAEAIDHHRNGRIADALSGYAHVLETDPDDPTALNFLGMLHVQFGDARLGASVIKRATEVAPDYAAAHCNLGTALVEIGESSDARTSYENSVAVDPRNAEAHNNLGVLLRYAGDLNGSMAHLLLAVEIRPDWASAQMNLGNTFVMTGNHDRAIQAYTEALAADPKLNDAYRMLGTAFYARGDLDKAAKVFRKLLEFDPENPIAPHMLAAVSQGESPERCPKEYVVSTFDQFASSFDKKLEMLDYDGPRLVMEAAARQLPPPGGDLRCLDLGAGTGLCGPLLKPHAREMIGVDLSQGMLEKAARRELYDELVLLDLCEYLGRDVGPFDLMISADVLIYFGALGEVLTAIADRLAPGGWLVFTVEAWADEQAPGYELRPSGRFAHGREYLTAQLDAAGLVLGSLEEAMLRKEMSERVSCYVVAAQRPAGAG